MKTVYLLALFTLFPASEGFATQAQPVPIPEDQSVAPQVEIAGVGIATLNYGNPIESTGSHYRGAIDFSDTSLLVGAAQRLFDGGIGSMGFGALIPDDSNSGIGNPFFLHQAFLDVQTESTEWLVGRTDNRSSHLVDFPTLREEDLITFTNPLNPFSKGDTLEEHRYSNVASFTLNQGMSYFENLHVQHLIDSRGAGSSPTSINSFGATFEYLCAPGMEALTRIVSYGVGYEHQLTDAPGNRGLNQLFAGGVVNLNESMTDRIDLRFQELVNFGSDSSRFTSVGDTYQANYNSLAASVRFLHSPFGKPGYQLALTGGYRNFFKVDQAASWTLALTAVKRLGDGFDLVAQYRTQYRDNALAGQYRGEKSENVIEVGFIFNFGSTFNRHLSPRRSSLNFQHQYIPN